MVPLRIIFLLVVAAKVVDSGGDSVISTSELIDKAELIVERIQDIWAKFAQSNFFSEIEKIKAIPDFENWVSSKLDDVDIHKLANDLKSFLLQVSTQLPSISTNTSILICGESLKLTNTSDDLQKVILAFKTELDHSDFAGELALAETFFQNQPFAQQLEKITSDIRSVLNALNTSCANGIDSEAILGGLFGSLKGS